MSRAFVFPGQGSQAVGMGQDLAQNFAAARDVFAQVDEALGQNLSQIMFEGPAETLTLTENAQPALMACSMAVLRVLETEKGTSLPDLCQAVAGHSLGEYTALCAAGALSLEHTAKLLRLRGQAMQRAVPVGEGAMAAILGLDLAAVRAIASEAGQGDVCSAANDNAPGQVVISGAVSAVARAIELAKTKGAKRAVALPVSAPFHCPLMAPAADAMAAALAETPISAPSVPMIANVTAEAADTPEQIRRLLVEQVTAMVRWRESVLALKALGVTELVELGAGKVLTGLTRRIDKELTGRSVSEAAHIEAFVLDL